jgi:pimeloyl-ACP methyl ester carboxylesterase
MNWDFIYRDETKPLDNITRAAITSGAFLELSNGFTHYELGGPQTGIPVILIHGFSVPYFIWDPTFQALTSLGFYVLRYDLFGRGFSDRPRLNYDLNLFVRQLHDLLDGLNFSGGNLVGLSMGGVIASAFTVQASQRVGKLVLIDPIGVQPMPLNKLYKTAILPGISEMLLGLIGTEQMINNTASDFYDLKDIKSFQHHFRKQLQIKGSKRAILSTLRNRMLDGFPGVYEQLGKLNLPILLLWGRNDHTLPIEQSDQLLNLIPNAEFRVVENSGHIPHYDRPDFVNPILNQFLTSK